MHYLQSEQAAHQLTLNRGKILKVMYQSKQVRTVDSIADSYENLLGSLFAASLHLLMGGKMSEKGKQHAFEIASKVVYALDETVSFYEEEIISYEKANQISPASLPADKDADRYVKIRKVAQIQEIVTDIVVADYLACLSMFDKTYFTPLELRDFAIELLKGKSAIDDVLDIE